MSSRSEFINVVIKDNELLISLKDLDKKVSFEDFIEDIFWYDLYLEIDGGGWQVITSENTNQYFEVDNYGYNNITELNGVGFASFRMLGTYKELIENNPELNH